MIPFARHTPATNELRYVGQALSAGLTSGDGAFTRRASALLAEQVGGAPVLLTTSCTHALEMQALVLGVAAGDEVVMPSYTFSSTANAFALRGATIRFADVSAGSWSMGPDQVEPLLSARTRVVVAVAYNGVSERLGELEALCRARGVTLVIDAAQAFGAAHRGRPVASFGAMAALSFHATKNLSCGEGGALILNEPTLRHTAEMIREKGTDRGSFLRGEIDKYTWRCVGSSYLPSEVNAAMLTAQLEEAAVIQRRRHAAWSTYRAALMPQASRHGIALQQIPDDDAHPAHLFGLLAPTPAARAALLTRLAARGIKAASHYEPLHRAPAHAGSEELPNTDAVATRIVRLPLHGAVDATVAARIADALLAALHEVA
jgi:dTDP-4-amino-4,6-dideoxygalactose transaminase